MTRDRQNGEVARIRELLAQMGRPVVPADQVSPAPSRMHKSTRGQDDGKATRPVPSVPAVTQPKEGSVGIVAAYRPETDGDARPARSTQGRIVWEGSAPGSEAGAVLVAARVAKRFGTSPRPFASPVELNLVLDTLERQVAFERIESLVRMRERSAEEIRRKLKADGFSEQASASALERALRCGLVSDVRYAEAFIASKLRAGWGRSRIERELSRGGVDPAAILADYPAAYFSPSDEQERARSLLAKKGVPAKNPVEKLARHLVTKGYTPSLALRLAREHVTSQGSGASEAETPYA